jgi:hypothetical protein
MSSSGPAVKLIFANFASFCPLVKVWLRGISGERETVREPIGVPPLTMLK